MSSWDLVDIEMQCSFGDEVVTVSLTHNRWGGGGYEFKAGDLSGKFHPTAVWGWLYHGEGLELDDIQILLQKICEANNLPDESLEFSHHIQIKRHVRRLIMTAADRKWAESKPDEFLAFKEAQKSRLK